MKIQIRLTLIISWCLISAMIAFATATSLILAGKAEEEYANLVDKVAEAQTANVDLYIKSLEGSFAALADMVESRPANERESLLIRYGENHPDVEYIKSDDSEIYNVNEIEIEIPDFEHDGKIYIIGYKEPPTKQFGLAVKNDSLVVIFSKDSINAIAASAEFRADGHILLKDAAANFLIGGEFAVVDMLYSSTGEWSVSANGDIKEARKLATDSLRGLIILTVILSIAGIALSIIIARKLRKKHEEEYTQLQIPVSKSGTDD